MLAKSINRNAFVIPIIMLSLMWLGYMLQSLGFFSNCFGAIIPLYPDGLLGIITSPFLHGSLEHIFGNSVPIAILLFLLYQFYPTIANKILITGWISAGLLVWLLPPIDIFTGQWNYSCIIGASGIVYVLAFFLFFSGIFRWERTLITISLLVALYYGSLVWGMLPEELFSNLQEPSRISWQSHLAGGLVGIIMAFLFRNIGMKKKKYIWEFPNYYSEKDDKLWQEYKENHPDDFLELPQKPKDNIWDHLDEIRKKEMQ
ncbi:rhomboid family intramembrane serine protease [Chryseobacterium sp. POL2]|uniref:rhomboid family intramembrane serine protease n=1 Tax=Chryseobacterium sp. POL2 TaxID=2713414 RepID=UPI0013E1363B|nr:rhomboid family intramembrane serine protease [Chryseobacterium sp. POL2]QIG90113.1 rhomboid family intramembrane serine protease [Chryseobacterium sp. POL2]